MEEKAKVVCPYCERKHSMEHSCNSEITSIE